MARVLGPVKGTGWRTVQRGWRGRQPLHAGGGACAPRNEVHGFATGVWTGDGSQAAVCIWRINMANSLPTVLIIAHGKLGASLLEMFLPVA